ncbi:MAG: electron transfer flavoprotein subunit alpha/FixB family protein, partial [Firmicutes bacterium]|nr:electron transfer flavoprotein subunit alpha/FixB family protein [Bacillota bacterium]
LSGVLLGQGVEGLASEAWAHGAQNVYLIDDPLLKNYRTQPHAHGLVALVQQYRPEILLLGATTLGRDLASAVATSLGTGLTADCTRLAIDPQTRLLEQTRPAFGGNIMATILCANRRPQMSTVRPRVMDMPARDPSRQGKLIRHELGMREDEMLTRMVEFVSAETADVVNLVDAEIIVAGGRGMGSPKNFGMLEELAKVVGGVVGASRAVVDAGWLSYAHQVGQTGQTVRPKIYISCGISGAIQHLVGMQTSDIIIAINSDPEAPIFKVATYGIVGDVLQVLPMLTEQLRSKL